MAKLIILLSVFITFHAMPTYGQADTNFKDFVIISNNIWALTNSGTIKIFDIKNGAALINKDFPTGERASAIAKDKKGNIVIADSNKEIKSYDRKNNHWQILAKSDSILIGIVFTNKNVCYGITSNGIEKLTKNNFCITYAEMCAGMHSDFSFSSVDLTCYFIDKDDNIWIGFGSGEYGGHFCVLKTRSKKHFASFTSLPVQSFFEDSQHVYSSSSLQHMGIIAGEIDRFDDFNPTTVFHSESKRDESLSGNTKTHMIAGEYVGVAIFNSFNNSIYFYSQHGIYRGYKSKDLSKFESWELVIKTSLTWQYGQRNAVGYQMNVSKLIVIDKNRFAFLSQNDGIGYFDGEKLVMLK